MQTVDRQVVVEEVQMEEDRLARRCVKMEEVASVVNASADRDILAIHVKMVRVKRNSSFYLIYDC